MSFCVLQVLLLDFTNTIWQLYIDFYTIRIIFESSFQLCIFKVANLKKIWQSWQKCVDRAFVHIKRRCVGPIILIEPCDLKPCEIEPNIIVYKGTVATDRTFVHAVRLRQS